MSWQAAAWMDALPYDVMKPLATRVLLKLANVAAQDGTRAYRNKWEVAGELGVDSRSVQRAYRELEAAQLIHKGDQQVVAHLRGDRRPTVYNLNFRYDVEYAQAELPEPDEDDDELPGEGDDHAGEFYGGTRLSTGAPESHGGTNGGTTEVPLGTKELSKPPFNPSSYVPERASATDNEDASGDTLAAAPPLAPGRCPARPVSPHAYNSRGVCLDCKQSRPEGDNA